VLATASQQRRLVRPPERAANHACGDLVRFCSAYCQQHLLPTSAEAIRCRPSPAWLPCFRPRNKQHSSLCKASRGSHGSVLSSCGPYLQALTTGFCAGSPAHKCNPPSQCTALTASGHCSHTTTRRLAHHQHTHTVSQGKRGDHACCTGSHVNISSHLRCIIAHGGSI